ncbi:hypothetical protein PR048_002862 [Dryococelus australis]|uniref:DDE-1 domain-containing protein n=1 Tax=Dryococelus australis TaxID=614101 RepID=A0ABQ9ILC9_9NEOP|nr:hypothetical protein PR048_002862 [Dryococelus australis]
MLMKLWDFKHKNWVDWLWSFLKSHPDLSIRKEENLSINRALSMNKSEVGLFFDFLEDKMAELNLTNKANRIFNIDESGFQLNTRPNTVVAPKGLSVIHEISPKEKGETITLVACFSVAGNDLPPCIVMKGKRTVVGLKEKLPAGSDVFHNEQSAYFNAQLFFVVIKKFVDYFHISKESPTILILDGNDSHCSNPDRVDFAVENGLCLLCLPPHTTNLLQPADKGIFAPLK